MARHPRYSPLNVYLNGRHVGQLRREPSGAIAFQYDPGWLAWSSALPVSLSLPLREDAYVGAPVSAVFENLLPDNDALRARIAARTHAAGTDAYSLLSSIGRDCVGALQFLPQSSPAHTPGIVRGTPITSSKIADILTDLASTPLGISEDDSFRISVAGAQEKTALLFWKDRWHKPLGTTATTHILKPSIGKLPNGIDLTHSVENEYLCLKIMESLGLSVAHAAMATFGQRRALVVERFDRLWSSDGRLLRLPQEDCCQALSVPPALKYESDGGPGIASILQLLRGSDDPLEDQRNFFKAVVVFWLLGAIDGHGKNFSVFLAPGGRYRLTPFYDVLSAQPAVDDKQIRHNRFRVAMAVGDNRHYAMNSIHPRHFLQTARLTGMSQQVVIEIFAFLQDATEAAVTGTLDELPKGFPDKVALSIQAGIKARLRLLGAGRSSSKSITA